MNVLHINTTDQGGGAELTMLELHHQLMNSGHQSHCLVGFKKSTWDFVSELKSPNFIQKLQNQIAIEQGKNCINFPSLLKQVEALDFNPEIIHIHNLHGNYLDFRELENLSKRFKVLLHLHDMWWLTGHCAHSFACDKWKTACGNCPDLNIYPAIRKDATAFNWQRKRKVLQNSKLHFVGPSQWIADKVEQAQIPFQSLAIIPNGVNTDIFKPRKKQEAREETGISKEKTVFLFSAKNPEKNEFKDFQTLKEAAITTAKQLPDQMFELIALGADKQSTIKQLNNLTIKFIPFQNQQNKVASYYQSADIYIHPAKAETFGRSIVEAMVCGIPVIASKVGGIPEIIEDEKSGYLLEPQNSMELANKIAKVLSNPTQTERLTDEAISTVKKKWMQTVIFNQIADLYGQIISLHD